MKLKQLLKNKYNSVGIIFLTAVIIRIAFSFAAKPLLSAHLLSYSMLNMVGQVLYAIPAIIFIGYLLKAKPEKRRELRFRRLRVSSTILMVIVGFCMIPIMAFLNAVSMLFSKNSTAGAMALMLKECPYIVLMLIVAFTPAILEEITYRTAFFGAFRNAGLLISVLTSAFLFGIMHLNLNQFFYAFIVGSIMAMIVELTDSIYSTMIVHFIINGTSVTLSYFYSKTGNNIEQQVKNIRPMLGISIAVYGMLAIVCLVIMVSAIYLICYLEHRLDYFQALNPFNKHVHLRKSQTQNVYSIPLVIGILICAGFMIYIDFIR